MMSTTYELCSYLSNAIALLTTARHASAEHPILASTHYLHSALEQCIALQINALLLQTRQTNHYKGKRVAQLHYLVNDVVPVPVVAESEQVVEAARAGADQLIPAPGVVAVAADTVHLIIL